MGRNIFKNGVGNGKDRSSGRIGRYKLPENVIDRELVEALFKHFISLDWQGEIAHNKPRYYKEVAGLEELIPEDVSGQTTLDGVMFKLTYDVSSELRWESGGFLTALVQVLYNKGENDCVIDTTLWDGHPPFIACFLKGEEDRLLKLTYRGFIGQFARDVDYCDLSFIGGGTTCGTDSSNSRFRLKIPEGQSMHQLGYCGNKNVFKAEGKVELAGPEGNDSTFYLTEHPMWEAPHTFEKFSENGNILHIGKDSDYGKIGS